jgi:hypothetical protein
MKGARYPITMVGGRCRHLDPNCLCSGLRSVSIHVPPKWLRSSTWKPSEKGYEQHSDREFGRYTEGRDHIAAMSAITLEGKLYMIEQEKAFKGEDALRILKHLMRQFRASRSLSGTALRCIAEVRSKMSLPGGRPGGSN